LGRRSLDEPDAPSPIILSSRRDDPSLEIPLILRLIKQALSSGAEPVPRYCADSFVPSMPELLQMLSMKVPLRTVLRRRAGENY
jgi:hypothetical protein